MTNATWALPVSSPAINVRRLVRYGLLAALVVTSVAVIQLVDAKRECKGSFSSAFGPGFDVYHCDLTIKVVGTDLSLSVPLPRQ